VLACDLQCARLDGFLQGAAREVAVGSSCEVSSPPVPETAAALSHERASPNDGSLGGFSRVDLDPGEAVPERSLIRVPSLAAAASSASSRSTI
jgi:hypothetical protein